MKLIADGGAITKNVAANTRDALILGLNRSYIDGFKMKIYMTKDKKIVTVSDDIYDFFVRKGHNINTFLLHELLAFNVGSKVHRQSILTLKEVLEIFSHYQKELVLELADHMSDNALFTDLVLNAIKPYSALNIYLESESKEIISYLKSSHPSHSVGISVNEASLSNWYEDVDFYDIAIALLGQLDIREKVATGKLIMINRINRQEVYNLVAEEFQDIFDSLFIITNYISAINYGLYG